MVLNSSNIVHYLLERGLVTGQQIVDGDYMVVEAPRRNRNFKIVRRDQTGLFLKQVQRWDQPSLATLKTEALCYQLTNQTEFAPLRNLVPEFHGYDEKSAVLVTELLPGGQSLNDYYYQHGKIPNEVATQLGSAFGRYHGQVKKPEVPERNPLFQRRIPWILSFHQLNPKMLVEVSGGNQQLLDILKRYPDFGRILDELAAEWKFETLVHGDIKWDNCVLIPDANGKVALKLVDWELADWGDPCWDVGAIFSAFLVFWMQSLPLTPGGSVTQAMAQAQYPIESMQPAIRAFWRAYNAELQLSPGAAQSLLRRSVLLCGARTVQTAYEFAQSSPQMNSLTYLIVQASLNILTKPAEASAELLGLTIQ